MGCDDKSPWTMPLPEFGKKYYGLGRSATYKAASRGDIPVLRLGGKFLGLPHIAEAMLSGAEVHFVMKSHKAITRKRRPGAKKSPGRPPKLKAI